MFIKTVEGDWINADHITRFDIAVTADGTVTARAFLNGQPLAIHKECYTGDESIDQMQDWLDHFIYEMSLD